MISILACEYNKHELVEHRNMKVSLIKLALDNGYKVYCFITKDSYKNTKVYYNGLGEEISKEEYDKLFKLWQMNNILGLDIDE